MGLDMYLKKKTVEEVAYWRKSNQIHNWFVKNIQGGEDDCRTYAVTAEQLYKLKSICKKVLENKELAKDLLPTSQGFFFGGTEYDEDYFSDLEDTIRMLSRIDDDTEYEYRASW